ncbi:hypothetical protein ACTNDG_05795 [Clostridium sp. HCP1S3_B4]|uniref:hypothetical protein n=1 Tax=unclassified Clostridium TaxID=2614128 RepID=UPI00169B2C1D|nr:hypothetical protein [Clostridiales bacterium]MDY2729723.1 hypothetical protein [Clostridium sp.]NLK23684.1 hypothetical protein [Clostridiales bacterium]
MSILLGATCIIAMIFMTVFTFIGIWLFIVALKAFNQLKYKNYILEKMYEKMDFQKETNEKMTFDEFKYYLDMTKENEENKIQYNSGKINNIKDFEKIR